MSEMTSNDTPPPATSEAAVSTASSSSTNNKDYSEMKADEARIQAEARRKRILEKANKRMNVVSGELPTLNEQNDNDGDDDGDNKIGSASNAARIRAARARMYGKKSTTAAGTGITAATTMISTTVTATGTTEENTNPKDSLPEDAPVETKEEDPAATVNKEELLTTISSADTTSSSAPFDEITEETLGVTTTTTPLPQQPPMEKKKYVGVAKMRRKMIAKKKLEEEEQADHVFTTTTDVDEAVTAVAVNKICVPKVPIYMHMVIVFLLFIAGLDVGIQQYHDDVTVHTQTAVQEYGLPFVHRKPWQPVNATQKTKLVLVEEIISASSTPGTNGPNGVVDDEFDDASGDDVEYVPNIDPLFRVDLDELTKGPGILNQFARGAVTVHRFMLQLLYYMPMALINTLLSIPMALIKVPPALFFIALILRQLVGKMILGAHIPDNKADQSGEQNNIEVISVAKNFVKNFFATNFPTLALAYDVFTHLRADMYIILCGVFCGMAWSHLTHSQDATGSMGDTEAAPLDGIGQEL